MKKLIIFALSALSITASAQHTVAPNGLEVTNTRAGLIWQRCLAGQSWNGTACSGVATQMTWSAALAYAETQVGWRLPNVKELSTIVDRTRVNPAINSTFFPGVSSGIIWSNTPLNDGNVYQAYHIGIQNGAVAFTTMTTAGYVRLVKN